MKYFVNGREVSQKHAKTVCESGYMNQGGCQDAFDIIWNGRFDTEECRDFLTEWSGYTVEFETEWHETE